MAMKSRTRPMLPFKGLLELAWYLTVMLAGLGILVDATEDTKSLDDNLQIDLDDYNNRKDLQLGKRGWSSLHSAWGKRDYPSEEEMDGQGLDKRAWQQLQAGWGKRFPPSDNDLLWRDEDDFDQEDSHEMDKRTWRSFNPGWGKRSTKWEKFRGSWGKRQPAWNNLKGLWGKRSLTE